MTSFRPWEREPIGPDYSYMIRASHSDGSSFMRTRFKFPLRGYVEAEASKAGVFAKRPELYAPGIYGYIHGWGSYHTPFAMYYVENSIVWQIAVVKNSEVVFNHKDGDNSCRAPRAWVKRTGTAAEIAELLDAEDAPYAGLVADNFRKQYTFQQKLFEPARKKLVLESFAPRGVKLRA